MPAPTPDSIDPAIKERLRKLLEFEASPEFDQLAEDHPLYDWYQYERQELEIELAYLQRPTPNLDPAKLDAEYERALQARTA